MNQTHLMSLVVIGGLLAGASSSLSANDKLWERTLMFVERSEYYVPGSIESSQRVLNDTGERRHQSTVQIRVNQREGQLRGKVESFYEDGIEGTLENRQKIENEFEKSISENPLHFVLDIPFSKEDLASLKVRKLSKTMRIADIECMGYEFVSSFHDVTLQDAPLSFRGIVWVDPETAVPTRIESALLESSIEVDAGKILGLSRQIDFEYTDRRWKMVHKRQEMWLNTRYFLKKCLLMVSNEVDLSDHFELRNSRT
jgi:hypothetical protein